MFIAGSRLFGKIDRVPGAFFIATNFVHVFFVPLIPVGTFFVLEKDNDFERFSGVRQPLSWKSILFAWVQAAAIVYVLIQVYDFYRAYTWTYDETLTFWERGPGWEGVAYIVLCIAIIWIVRKLSIATPGRARELAVLAELDPGHVAAHLKCMTTSRSRKSQQ